MRIAEQFIYSKEENIVKKNALDGDLKFITTIGFKGNLLRF
jgi:hypothetical protein